MPGSSPTLPRRRVAPAGFDPWHDPGVALVLLDDAPLKRAAWAELHAARKRQEKAARDLHRHEQIDRPAYDEWLHRTFPTFVTRLRELHHEVFGKAERVKHVQAMAAFTGRSARKLWREMKEQEANPSAAGQQEDHDDDFFDDDADDFFDDRQRHARGHARAQAEDDFEPRPSASRPTPPPGAEARNVYRRLVQRLHPDRGGEWTAARQRLWHEVQLAWDAGDADWLTRLEVEWEAANDVLDAASPLSRLRGAVAEFHAARRDTERKLRAYRGSPPWRFTLTEKKRAELHRRTELNFRHDVVFLERQLAHLDALIASWEKTPGERRLARARHVDFRFYD
ncbi:MAG: hypothetical protein JNK23_06970 [Opitutaceae bacterium]|nr:hypothetical protein [Opitutaceae bacterium]